MPLPTPEPDEKTDAFVERCMADPEAVKTFPDQKQRAAVCYRQAKGRDDKEKASRPVMSIEATVTFDLEGEKP